MRLPRFAKGSVSILRFRYIHNIFAPESSIAGAIRSRFDISSFRAEQGFESPMSSMEAYRILNVNPSSSTEQIRKAHRDLMLRNHPDNGGSNFVASKVNEAKELILGKGGKR
uniref:J domain-containing protein n=1 Tax=Chromera velia CCMP2878 TaxID=1169474 RepID=A0A0G4I8V3_9ALVE|eukprot:Cvel_1990.t1-p1 / transcript=Cvel_1990.t1 / gene=Cvel_1990 / organism=Chromera_velia_CCMP2878 / gene_product=DnaJ homolog subfamily C member 15, putative / transcript_product=DnaJ homolog subfamily C member 15, putative / location=Cvel_scaffold76:256-1777(+) / protein_length=111 / sequence_SO=supercontig / SO=protein_coding / is_pseudo=false